jgi:hypothetical protein
LLVAAVLVAVLVVQVTAAAVVAAAAAFCRRLSTYLLVHTLSPLALVALVAVRAATI